MGEPVSAGKPLVAPRLKARATDEQIAEWRESVKRICEADFNDWDHGCVADEAEKLTAALDELEAERARAARRPAISIEWSKDAPCGYCHVDIRMADGVQRVIGWVVPDGLEDRLPSFGDGMKWPSNPFFEYAEGTEGDG